MKKKLNLDEVLGDMGAKKGERITDNITKSLLDTEQVIKVSLSNIYVAPQIRLRIDSGTVDGIVATYPLRNNAEIRKWDPSIDGESTGCDYVLLTGEHRFRALEIIGFAEHDFKFVPPSVIKTKADVIKYQYIENNTRADMHFIEKARSFVDYMKEANFSQGEAGKVLHVSATLTSRYVRVTKFLTKDDDLLLLKLGIKSERVIVGISKLIELGYADWFAVIKEYALNAEGIFDPELIYEKTINQIIKDLTAPPESSNESENTGESETSQPTKQFGDDVDIVPNAFKEESNDVEKEPAKPAVNTQTQIINNDDLDDDDFEPETTQSKPKSKVLAEKGEAATAPPTPPPTASHPAVGESEKQAAYKLAAKVLQKILNGEEVEEILIDLGSDLKKFVSKEDGEDIYEMIQNLPFN